MTTSDLSSGASVAPRFKVGDGVLVSDSRRSRFGDIGTIRAFEPESSLSCVVEFAERTYVEYAADELTPLSAAPPSGKAPFDHSGETQRVWIPGLGPCVCVHCRTLPDFAPRDGQPLRASAPRLSVDAAEKRRMSVGDAKAMIERFWQARVSLIIEGSSTANRDEHKAAFHAMLAALTQWTGDKA